MLNDKVFIRAKSNEITKTKLTQQASTRNESEWKKREARSEKYITATQLKASTQRWRDNNSVSGLRIITFTRQELLHFPTLL